MVNVLSVFCCDLIILMKQFYCSCRYLNIVLLIGLLISCKPKDKISPESSAKLNWMVIDTAGGKEYDTAEAITIDTSGNVYVAGGIGATSKFGSVTKAVEGRNAVFLAKYNNQNSLEWVQTIGGELMEYLADIAVDSKGNIYLTGSFFYTAKFGSISKTAKGESDVFLAKYDANGNILWVQTIDSARATGIALDKNENVYVGGSFTGTANFGGISKISLRNNQGFSNPDIFIAKYTSDGLFQKVETAAGENYDSVEDIAVDNQQNVYLTGKFEGVADFHGIIKGDNSRMTSENFYVAKYNANFEIQWVQTANSSFGNNGSVLEIDKNGNIYVAGNFTSNTKWGSIEKVSNGYNRFITMLDKNGNYQWVQTITGSITDIHDISVDEKGGIYLTGFFLGKIDFHGKVETSVGLHDIYVAKYLSSGKPQWIKTAGGTNSDFSNGIVVGNNGVVYITGCFEETSNFGDVSKTAAGITDVFVAKLQ